MTEAKKMMFFANDLKVQAFGFSADMFQETLNSVLKPFPGQAFTIQAWVKTNATVTGELVSVILSGSDNNYGFTVIIDNDEQLVGVQQNIAFIYTGVSIPTGVWTHIAFTRDTGGTLVKAYVNGSKVHEQVVKPQGQVPNCVHFYSSSATAHYRDIAKLSIHGVEFTADEIAAEYVNFSAISRKDDLLALYIDGVHGGSLIDFCGNYNVLCGDKIQNRGVFKL